MTYQPRRDIIELAGKLAASIDSDVFFYNGEIAGGPDLQFIELIHKNKLRKKALLLLTTHGGDPDAAYRIARYFQERYEWLTVLIGGRCKSAARKSLRPQLPKTPKTRARPDDMWPRQAPPTAC